MRDIIVLLSAVLLMLFFFDIQIDIQVIVTNINKYSTLVTAVSTVVIALFTYFLYQANKKAADVAEKAIVDLERPYISVNIINSGLSIDSSGKIFFSNSYDFKVGFINHGNTPAYIIELFYEFSIKNKGDLPDVIIHSNLSEDNLRTLPFGMVSAKNFPYEEKEKPMVAYDSKIYEDGAWKKYDIFFIGVMKYRDIFNSDYILGFCAKFDPIGNRYIFVGDDKYNYTRKL